MIMKILERVLSKIFSLALLWEGTKKKVTVSEFLEREIILEHPFRVISMFLFTLLLYILLGLIGSYYTINHILQILSNLIHKNFDFSSIVILLIAVPLSSFGIIVCFSATCKYALEIQALILLLYRSKEVYGNVEKIEYSIRTGKNWKTITKHCTVSFLSPLGEKITMIGTNSDGYFHDILEQEIEENRQIKILLDPKNPRIARMIHKES